MRVMIRSNLFILCSPDKGLICCIDIHLITLYRCKLDMTVYSAIIGYLSHPLIFVLLRYYLMYVKLQFRKIYKSKATEK
jgi:hypothetical protein